MSLVIWRIASDTPDWEAHNLSGRGAELLGGRWNRPGTPVVYCAGSIALAALETAVHVEADDLPLNRFLVSVSIPDALWKARMVHTAQSLPVGWTARPAGKVSLDLGDAWLAASSTALLQVPSVIVPEEFNVLINPQHPGAAQIKAVKVRAWRLDERVKR